MAKVHASDIEPDGCDFLACNQTPDNCEAIITNPPRDPTLSSIVAKKDLEKNPAPVPNIAPECPRSSSDRRSHLECRLPRHGAINGGNFRDLGHIG
jgi:hypothetical protein